MRVDLNADLGEGMGGPEGDAEMLAVVSSANVACGGHAGDAASMLMVCRTAVEHTVRIGAHVSYPDRDNFGRIALDMEADLLLALLREQRDALAEAANAVGGSVTYIKPHGALYHQVSHDPEQAEVVVRLAEEAGCAVVGLPGGVVLDLAREAGIDAIPEAFADRGYLPSGALVSRGTLGDVLHDADVVAARMVRLVRDGVVEAGDGSLVSVAARSICVHSDTPGAVLIARAVRDALTAADVQIRPA